jgi:hypothetical protein
MPAGETSIRQAREILESRARELREELTQIERALAQLDSEGGATGTASRRSGKRGDQAVQLITEHPGIEIRELSEKMGLKGPHYLYRLLPRLERQGLIVKDGEGFRVAR